MDYLSMDNAMKRKLKIRCESDADDHPKCPFEYYQFQHFKRYGEDAMIELKQHKAMNAVLASRHI